MADYLDLIQTLVQEVKSREEALPLMNENCGSRFFLHPKPTRNVCLFFHGFTATPEQFIPLGEACFDAGCNVLIPLQPGHGIAGDWDRKNPPPLPENRQIYQDFGLHWLEVAKQLGERAILGGLSTGSTLAAWLALDRPQEIYRTLAFAPYLSSSNPLADWVVRIFNIYYKWYKQLGRVHFGYNGFKMSALRIFLEMADEVRDRAKKTAGAPMFVISSASDRAVGNSAQKALFKAAVKRQPKSWYYCFDKRLNIPHTMMTRAEGNHHLGLLIAIAKAYLDSDITWDEVAALAGLVRQGESFNAAVNQLNLAHRVAPELAAMVAGVSQQKLSSPSFFPSATSEG